MKLDSDTAVLQSLVHRPNSNPFKIDNDIMDTADHKSCKEIVIESKIGTNVGFWPVSDFDSSVSSDKLTRGNEMAEDTKLLEEELDIFTDKNVTECEVSEVIIAGDKEEPCHEVKEIRIDETAVHKVVDAVLCTPSPLSSCLVEEKPEHDGSDVLEGLGHEPHEPEVELHGTEIPDTIATTNELPYSSSKVEKGNITFGFKEGESPSANPKVNHVSDSRVGSGRDLYSNGESSFSMAGPMSGLITYSGPIACSGSVSLRSESSTTSTRSFAFPIMQNEWNSSPARMAKADRSRLRKQKGWRQGILCCRF